MSLWKRGSRRKSSDEFIRTIVFGLAGDVLQKTAAVAGRQVESRSIALIRESNGHNTRGSSREDGGVNDPTFDKSKGKSTLPQDKPSPLAHKIE
jgi:hypothetical protein